MFTPARAQPRAKPRQAPVASVAMVSNAVDHAARSLITAYRMVACEFSKGSLEQPDLFSPLGDPFHLALRRLDD